MTARVGNCCNHRVSMRVCERLRLRHPCRSSIGTISRSKSVLPRDFRFARGTRTTKGVFSQVFKELSADSRRPTAFTNEVLAERFTVNQRRKCLRQTSRRCPTTLARWTTPMSNDTSPARHGSAASYSPRCYLPTCCPKSEGGGARMSTTCPSCQFG